MPGWFPTGHRRRGEGLGLDQLSEIERAQILSRHRGNVWYVDSNAVAGGNGNSWSGAFLTVTLAMAAALADDRILIAPLHAENISTAAFIACNKAGVTLIGFGNGRRRPVFTWTATAGTITVTAADVSWQNCVFIGEGIDAVVTMFSVTADGCTFSNCEFQIGKTSFVPLLGITITGAINRFQFYDNYVHGKAVANCTNFIQIAGGGDGHRFEGNTIIGNFTTTLGCINNITTLCTNVVIVDNTFVNATASATKVAVFLTGSYGIIMRNRTGVGSGAAPFSMDAGYWAGNWSCAAVATNGTLV